MGKVYKQCECVWRKIGDLMKILRKVYCLMIFKLDCDEEME